MGEDGYFKKLCRKAGQTRSADELIQSKERESGGTLKKVLGPIDLLMFGVGMIIGAGVFVLTGTAAKDHAGPAIVASYGIASAAAMFSALCYAEFAAEVPVAGSAFNYVGMIYGEFLAWIAAINLIAEYSLSSSTVAKGIAGYFASLCGLKTNAFIIEMNDYIVIDIPAIILIILICLLLAKGVRESSTFQNCISAVNLLTVFIVIGAAIPFFKADNLSPFLPPEFGYRGMFHASSIVFFSYIGFDGVATAAEEVKNPKRDLPFGIIGSISVCTVLFMAMGLSVVGMVKYNLIDENAPFSEAFAMVGVPQVGYVVAVGALTGIVTSELMCLYGMTRILMVLGREGFLPTWLAKVDERTHTPLNATITTGLMAALPALFLQMGVLAIMVSMGTLAVMCIVCAGVLTKKYRADTLKSKLPHDILVPTIIIASLVEGLCSHWAAPVWTIGASLGVWLLATIGLAFSPGVKNSDKFNTPLKPLIPSCGVLFTMHLMCSLGLAAYIRFIVWQVVGIAVYMMYSVHRTKESSEITQKLIGVADPPML
ncbi:hypothetical protein BSKO_04526 [Bryopsis sp. KO-2023]|nr:hypothetical protein BSKO_04526 [Bryopsis sp. KO-2023]